MTPKQKRLLKDARDLLVMCTLNDKSGQCSEMVERIDAEMKGSTIEPKCKSCKWFKIGYGRCQWCIYNTEDSWQDKSCTNKYESI